MREAEKLGLKCGQVSTSNLCLCIGGHRCQVVSSKLFENGKHVVTPLYLPRRRWADFLIYVAVRPGEPEPSFYIVPRQTTCRETSISSRENWLHNYKDAWEPLFTEPTPLQEAQKPFETVNWKLKHALSELRERGYEIKRVKKAGNKREFVKNRVLINGKKCQLMAAARLSNDPADSHWNAITLHASRQPWADYLIFILKSERLSFIIPRCRLQTSTTASLEMDWMKEYQERWDFLNADYATPDVAIPAREAHQQICRASECSKPSKNNGLCRKHYNRLLRELGGTNDSLEEIPSTQQPAPEIQPTQEALEAIKERPKRVKVALAPKKPIVRKWVLAEPIVIPPRRSLEEELDDQVQRINEMFKQK